ncbi:MAG: hypothetical protein R3B95_08415 [Nitrospirales bacterium]|nr:hypothetical protein [Nitrospirales bacterium]
MRHSQTSTRNPVIKDWTSKYGKRTNLQFFDEAFASLQKQDIGNRGLMTVGLIGSRDVPGHTLRTAQSMLRWDLRPSFWSHVFVVAESVTSRTSLSPCRFWRSRCIHGMESSQGRNVMASTKAL